MVRIIQEKDMCRKCNQNKKKSKKPSTAPKIPREEYNEMMAQHKRRMILISLGYRQYKDEAQYNKEFNPRYSK